MRYPSRTFGIGSSVARSLAHWVGALPCVDCCWITTACLGRRLRLLAVSQTCDGSICAKTVLRRLSRDSLTSFQSGGHQSRSNFSCAFGLRPLHVAADSCQRARCQVPLLALLLAALLCKIYVITTKRISISYEQQGCISCWLELLQVA